MKFAYHCELRDNPYPTYLVYILDLYIHEDLKSAPGPRARRESCPPVVWGLPFPGCSGYLISLSVNSGRKVHLGFLVFEIYLVSLSWCHKPIVGVCTQYLDLVDCCRQILFRKVCPPRFLISAQSVQSRKSENQNLPSFRSDLPHLIPFVLPARRRLWMLFLYRYSKLQNRF